MKMIYVKRFSKQFNTIQLAKIPEGYLFEEDGIQEEISEEEFNNTEKEFVINMVLNISCPLYEIKKEGLKTCHSNQDHPRKLFHQISKLKCKLVSLKNKLLLLQ